MERHWNVLKFTCGLMEDSSLLIERICQAFVEIITNPNPSESFGSLYGSLYLKDLFREKSAKSVSPFSNAHVCYVRHCNIPADSNYSLYYFNGWDTSREDESSSDAVKHLDSKSTDTAEKLQPCSVVIQQGPRTPLVKYFRTIKRFDEQPIRKLLIFGDKTTHSPTYDSALGDSCKVTRPLWESEKKLDDSCNDTRPLWESEKKLDGSCKDTRPLWESEKKPFKVSPTLREPEFEHVHPLLEAEREPFEDAPTYLEAEDDIFEDARSSWGPDGESVEVSSSSLPGGCEIDFQSDFNISHHTCSFRESARNFCDNIALKLDSLVVAVFQKVNCSDGLSDSLKKCTKLTHLAYINCRDPTFDTLGNNKDLKELTMENCSHNLKAESDLCAQLIYLTQLEQISIRRTITEANLEKIIKESVFSSLTSLKKLSLQDCMLTTPTALTLMKSLMQCPLVELDLSNNFLDGFINELHQIRSVSFKHLERMHCNNSNLLGTDTAGLARLILEKRLPTIKIVFMKGNELAGEKTACEELDNLIRKKKGHRVQVYITRKEDKKNSGINDGVIDSEIKDEIEHSEKESSRSHQRKRPEGVIRSLIRRHCNIL